MRGERCTSETIKITITTGEMPDLMLRLDSKVAPLARAASGFIAYYAVATGKTAAAVAAEMVSPVVLGRRLHRMRFEPAHAAERFGILIIALGRERGLGRDGRGPVPADHRAADLRRSDCAVGHGHLSGGSVWRVHASSSCRDADGPE